MTKYRFYRQGGEKRIFLSSLSPTTDYTIPLSQTHPFPTQNPTPTSCRASLDTLESPNSVYHKAQSTRINAISQSLIVRNSKAISKGKSKKDRVFAGEGKVLPRLWWRGFEGVRCSLLLVSEIGVRIPIKARVDEGLGSSGQIKGWKREIGLSEVVIRAYGKGGWKGFHAICICYKGLEDNSMINSHYKEIKMKY